MKSGSWTSCAAAHALRAIGVVALLGCATAFAHEPDAEEIALGSLVDAELALAGSAHRLGVAPAFRSALAPEGLLLWRTPLRARDLAGPAPRAITTTVATLAWQPAQAGVARSYDMGYTTGSSTTADPTRPGAMAHGVYFAVWRRAGGRPWQLILRTDVATPGPIDFVPLGEAPRSRFHGVGSERAERPRLLALESTLARPRSAASAALESLIPLAGGARLYRPDAWPLAHATASSPSNLLAPAPTARVPERLMLSRAADMAVSHGEIRPEPAGTGGRGRYVHLWVRDERGRWGLAYDIVNASGS